MKLEAQLAELASLGITLAPGVTVDDLLYSMARRAYEEKPFDELLFALGIEVEREPWGRPFSHHAWHFDTECIDADGDYADIVHHLGRLAGASERLTDVRDHVDIDRGEAWLEYTLDGQRRHFDVQVEDDWADARVVSQVMTDFEGNGGHFYAKENGQAVTLFFLDEATAKAMNRLSKGALERAVK